MNVCTECGGSRVKAVLLPEYETEVGGLKVRLLNAVVREVCEDCGDATVEIPNLEGMVKTVAVARALLPIRLRGSDVRLMRQALDMNGRQFAAAMELTPETVSRWESGERGIGGYSEKLLRHNVCALLHRQVPELDYDPAEITTMEIFDADDDHVLPTFELRRVLVRDRGQREEAWDMPLAA